MTTPSKLRPDVWSAFRACRLWRTASDEAVSKLAADARVREVARGTSLAIEGDAAREFGVVVAGRVRVFYLGADGRQITFETLETGDPLAAVAALAGGATPRTLRPLLLRPWPVCLPMLSSRCSRRSLTSPVRSSPIWPLGW